MSACIAGIIPDEKQIELMRLLSAIYTESRYPEEAEEIDDDPLYNETKEIYERTLEACKWLLSLI